jgi:hypothetical protein
MMSFYLLSPDLFGNAVEDDAGADETQAHEEEQPENLTITATREIEASLGNQDLRSSHRSGRG